MLHQDLIVVVPHSGIIIPSEINEASLSDSFSRLAQNVDWYTNWLYDFRDILDNQHIVFPYCSVVIEANRHPDILDDCVPLRDVNGHPVYRPGYEPSIAVRKQMTDKYLVKFHQKIQDMILSGAIFLFDGHSTISARGVSDNQIDLMNFQHSNIDPEPRVFCPDILVETYASELRKRLPEIKVTVNASEYYKVYGHVCSAHTINSFKRCYDKVPGLIQETNERLYKNSDRTPNITAINRLRTAFAESLKATLAIISTYQQTRTHHD